MRTISRHVSGNAVNALLRRLDSNLMGLFTFALQQRPGACNCRPRACSALCHGSTAARSPIFRVWRLAASAVERSHLDYQRRAHEFDTIGIVRLMTGAGRSRWAEQAGKH